MSMHEVAKHLSAMGRHGDTTLVHMSPQEVSNLHGIAALHGTHLTTNPHTGLPEAFNLGGFFKSLLPTLAGAAATALSGGTLAPVLAGAATGAALNGSNPLMGALTGGLGGFGGMGIADALQSAGGAAGSGASAAGSGAGGATSSQSASAIADAAGSAAGAGQAPMAAMSGTPGGAAAGRMNPQLAAASGGFQGSGSPMISGGSTGSVTGSAAASQGPNTFGQMGQGIANLGNSAGRDAFVKSLGGTGPNADLLAAGKAGMPLAMAGLAGIEPPKMEEDKYDPYASLNLRGDSGLRLFAGGGGVDTYNPDNPGAATNLSRDGYGLSSFQKQNPDPQPFQIAQQPSPMNYARGGYLDGPGDGMSDSIHATIEGKQPARLADGEFVVPADVVSHLGNGSTKAGAQRLYGMLDKVRKARTGTTQQGKQINPKKYLPA